MAIYVLFKCLRCDKEGHTSEIRKHLYSCSRNKDYIRSRVCDHFEVIYSYEAKWGVFTIGWKIRINVKHICQKCGKTRCYEEKTYNSKNYQFDEYKDCCYNVFSYSVRGYDYGSGDGYRLQDNLDEELRKEKERKREEQERKRKREEERKRKEEIERERKRQEMENKRKEEQIFNQIEEESNKLTEELNNICDINWIEDENNQIMINEETKFSININFNIKAEINKIYNYKIVKTK